MTPVSPDTWLSFAAILITVLGSTCGIVWKLSAMNGKLDAQEMAIRELSMQLNFTKEDQNRRDSKIFSELHNLNSRMTKVETIIEVAGRHAPKTADNGG